MRIEDIDHAVCDVLELTRGCLQSAERAWSVSHPRMLAMFLARKHTSASHSEIGRYLVAQSQHRCRRREEGAKLARKRFASSMRARKATEFRDSEPYRESFESVKAGRGELRTTA